MPVAGLKGLQIGYGHTKHVSIVSLGNLQFSSGPPLGVRGLEGLSTGQCWQLGGRRTNLVNNMSGQHYNQNFLVYFQIKYNLYIYL
jgi:hypothetical protein